MESEINLDGTTWWNILRYGEPPNIKISTEDDETILDSIKFISRREQQILDLANSETTKVIFRNCHFLIHDSDSLSNLEIRRGYSRHLIIENCGISNLSIDNLDRVYLKKLRLSSLVIDNAQRARVEDSSANVFSSNNTTFVSEVKLLPREKEASINISKCTFEKSLIISEQNLKTLRLKNLIIENDKLQVQKCHFINSPQLNNITAAAISIKSNNGEYLVLDDFKTSNLHIYRNRVNVDINNGSITQGKINLNQGDIYIKNIENEEGLLVEKNFCRDIIINNQALEGIILSSNSSKLSFNNISCNQFPDLSENSFSEISIQEVKQTRGSWELNINKALKVELNDLHLESLFIKGSDIEETQLSEINANVDINLKNGIKLNISNNKSEHANLKIDLESFETCLIEKSNYSKVILSGLGNGLLELSENDFHSTTMLLKDIKKVAITNLNSQKVLVENSQIQEFIINSTENSEKTLINFLLTNSTIDSFSSKSLTTDNLTLHSLVSKQFQFIAEYYNNLKIIDCKTSDIVFGGNDKINTTTSTIWAFNKTPSNSIKVEKSIISMLYIEHGNEHSGNDNELSIQLSNSKIASLESKDLNLQLLSSESCEIENALHSTISPITLVEIASNQDKYGSLEFFNSTGKASFNNSTFKLIKIDLSTFEILEISNCKSNEHPYAIEELNIQDSQINRLNAHDSKIKKLEINNLKPLEFHLSDLSIHDFSLNKFKKNQNSSEFELNFINIEDQSRRGSISFIDSDLTGLSFNSCYFESFKELVVKSSKLDKINCTATTWPQMVTSQDGKKKQFEIREACRQLKFAMAAHHDKVSELLFHALEMNAYRKIVRSKGWHPRFWNDRLSLLAGSSNKFGLNWFIPLVLITLFLTLNYIAIL